MRTFIFYQNNSSATMTISAPTYDEAWETLSDEVSSTWGWRCDDEEGEGEDE